MPKSSAEPPPPFEVEKAQEEGKPLCVPYKGQVAHVTYGEDKMSGKEWQDLNLPLPEGETGFPFNVRFLARVLLSWDLTVKHEPVPITAEALHDLPPKLVAAIAEAVMGDLFPPPPSPESGGSFS